MADVRAGPLPFREAYPEFARKSTSKKYLAEHHNPLHGWTAAPKKPATRRLVSSSGNIYEMPDEDTEQFLTFMRSESEKSQQYSDSERKTLKNVQTPADYIDFVFDEQRLKYLKKPQVEEMPVKPDASGETGHILYLWYNTRYMLLKVKFWNDTVCCFFNVPARVVALLMHYAQNSTLAPPGKNGKKRHALGVEFWNLIRIRGSKHATRYPFEYVTDNNVQHVNKYIYDTQWSDRLQRDVQVRMNKEELHSEEDTRLMNRLREEEQAADKLDVVYDYEDEDLVTFFENGAYDDLLGRVSPQQRSLLMKAERMYNAAQPIGDIERTLRATNLEFPSIKELHAKYD